MNKDPDRRPKLRDTSDPDDDDTPTAVDDKRTVPVEIGGRDGPDPVRYGDWEKAGRCIDF